MNFKFLFLALLLLTSLLIIHTGEAGATVWTSVADEIGDKLSEARDLYERGEAKGAKSRVTDAYFDLFEGMGMETTITLRISEERMYKLETMFGNIRRAIDRNATPSELSEMMNNLLAALKEDAKELDMASEESGGKAHPYSTLFDSFIIIVREGFEAILIIGALAAYLAKTGHADKVGRIYLGGGLALFASILTAIILNTMITISGEAREGLEGVTMLIATAVLFYVSYWLISKAEAARWHSFIKEKVEASLSGASVFALSSAAFLAVYREGAETILFYQALLSGAGEAGKSTVFYGFAAGAVVLIAIFFAIKYTSLKVAIGPFFAVTSTLLYYLALSFAGKGILELQEAEWVSTTPANFPTIHFLGVYPSVEGLALQGVLLVAAVAAGLYTVLSSYRERKVVIGDISHITGDINSIHDLLEHIKEHIKKSRKIWESVEGEESLHVRDIKGHLDEVDSKTHEVMEHLSHLKEGLTDIFGELEKGMEKRK